MADEKRIATFEWLNDNLYEFRKGSPPNNKKGVTKTELINTYNVDESLLNNHTSNRLVARMFCKGVSKAFQITGVDINDMIFQTDNKFIVVGLFNYVNNVACQNICRLNFDGTLDTSFNCVVDDIVNCVTVQSDGKILIGGWFTSVNGQPMNRLARLNSNGTLDTSFTSHFSTDDKATIYDVEVDSIGRIIIAGWFFSYQNNNGNVVFRLNSNGTIDGSWQRMTTSGNNIYHNLKDSSVGRCIAILPNNSVFIGGQNINIISGNTTYVKRSLAFYKTDGTIDMNFTNNNSMPILSSYNSIIYNDTSSRKCIVFCGHQYENNNSNTYSAIMGSFNFNMVNNVVQQSSVTIANWGTSSLPINSTLNRLRNTNDSKLYNGLRIYVSGSNSSYSCISSYGLGLHASNSWMPLDASDSADVIVDATVTINKNGKTVTGLLNSYQGNLIYLDPRFN